MRVKCKLEFLGVDLRQGKSNPEKYYKTVSFLDGNQSINILVDDENLFNNMKVVEKFTICDCELDLVLGKYTNCKLTMCQPALAKK